MYFTQLLHLFIQHYKSIFIDLDVNNVLITVFSSTISNSSFGSYNFIDYLLPHLE